MTFNNTRTRISNSSAQIAEALQDEILQGVLQPAQKLNQSAIAKQFGVSKIPVREALHRLEADGLVTFQPNGSATVAVISASEMQQIFLMRIGMEQLLLQHAVPNLTEVDLVKAENALRLIDHETDAYQWMKLNWEFHASLYTPANMPYVMHSLQKLYINAVRYIVVRQVFDNLKKSQQEHREILEACRAGDVARAMAGLEAHLGTSAGDMVGYLSG